jgi:acyl-CoA reductase-like NAD-dependent aldehyde dehydrogenase
MSSEAVISVSAISARLAALGEEVEARREELAEHVVRTSKKARRVAEGEIALALARLRAFPSIEPLLEGRAPVGSVAVVFPGNAALSNPVATLGTAALAGNRVLARFPRASRPWAEVAEPLLLSHLPDLEFDHGPGRTFLNRVLADPEVAVVMVFGDDSWAAEYEEPVRRHRKRLIFEGPGKDPFLVLPGADVERAARDGVRAACHDAGQACTSPERFYVHRDLADRFVEAAVEHAGRAVVGPPEDPATTVGPIVNRRIAERIDRQLRDAFARGARALTGGRIREERLRDGTPAFYVAPTVLVDVDHRMEVMRDETFGPLVPVRRVVDTEEAVTLAEGSRYGLTATLYGGDDGVAESLARSHGRVYRDEIWTDFHRREVHAPYGGRKQSGWVWEWRDEGFRRREGPRTNALEFTRAD